MTVSPASDRPGSFGRVWIDNSKRQAWLDGRMVPLSGLPLRILEELLAAEGSLVPRASLKRLLWPYAERIDTERRLNTAIRALREALGDTAAKPQLILTLRGHGYRWIGHQARPLQRFPYLLHAAAACLALVAAPTTPGFIPANAERALPADLAASRMLAWSYVNQGRPAVALPHIAALLQSTGGDGSDRAQTGWLLLRAGMPEAALVTCSGMANPTLNLLSCRQTALARLGLTSGARDVGVAVMRLAGADISAIRAVANAPVALGYARFLRWRIAAFVRPNRDWFQRAQLQADAGLYRQALASLQRAAATHDPLLVKIGSSAEFAPLHRMPEYRRIAVAYAGARLT